MELKRVVITGLGAVTPIGNSVEDYWTGLANGISGAAPITLYDSSKFKTNFACEVKDWEITDFIDRKDARKMDRYTHFAMVSSHQAIEDSGLDLENIDKRKAGVIWGSGIGGLKTFQDESIAFGQGDGTPRFNPFFIPKMIADIAAGQIWIRLQMQ